MKVPYNLNVPPVMQFECKHEVSDWCCEYTKKNTTFFMSMRTVGILHLSFFMCNFQNMGV